MGTDGLEIIRFGIPGLDRLLGQGKQRADGTWEYGATVERNHSTTVCIIGRDGTGKSVLALHLVSRYLADAKGANEASKIGCIYVSTDLSFSKARSIWMAFGLDKPNLRK